jgi:hypothetical protein
MTGERRGGGVETVSFFRIYFVSFSLFDPLEVRSLGDTRHASEEKSFGIVL